jgi:CRP-like cAMP-binding protein
MQAKEPQLTIMDVLQSSTLLNALSQEEKLELSRHCSQARASRGEVIWLNGDEVDYFGLLGNGFVKMVKGSYLGTDATLEIIGPGQIFGLLGAIEGTGCPLTAISVTDSLYLKILKSAFLPIYEKNAALKDRLIRRTSMRLHSKHDLIAHLSSGKVEQRIAAILLLLAESYGHENEIGLQIDVPLTRQDISEMAGTTVESTIRTMSKWQKEGIIETEKHYVTIKDKKAFNIFLA